MVDDDNCTEFATRYRKMFADGQRIGALPGTATGYEAQKQLRYRFDGSSGDGAIEEHIGRPEVT